MDDFTVRSMAELSMACWGGAGGVSQCRSPGRARGSGKAWKIPA